MTYTVKEIFYTLQGEGVQTGVPAIFCRFSGCNLWSGKEEDRVRSVCGFCDTDFLGTDGPLGGIFENAEELAESITEVLPTGVSTTAKPLVVLTGGEPALQADNALIEAIHRFGYKIAIETNGTLPLPAGIDWVTVSPKANTKLAVQSGDELKIVYPQGDISPESFENLDFKHFVLQPQDGKDLKKNIKACLMHCFAHPRWRLGVQSHKIIGIR